MEYSLDSFSYLIVEPVGYNHTAKLPEGYHSDGDHFSWSNKYTVAYVNGWEQISGRSYVPWLHEISGQDVRFGKCGEAIEPLQLILWPLADSGSV